LIGYAERCCLLPGAVEAYRRACVLVDRVSHVDRAGNEVRCHELSRAVAHQLTAIGTKVEVVDGSLWWIDHSWILLPGQVEGALLDVYAPGRVPQVQLLHDHHVVTRGYERGPARLDVRTDVVDVLCRLMEHTSNMPPELSQMQQRADTATGSTRRSRTVKPVTKTP
jgi:hypothetical protein